MWKGPKSLVEYQDGVKEDNFGEAVPPFRRVLPDDGQELLDQTLIKEDGEILDSAADGDIQEDEDEDEDEDEYDDDTDMDESSNEADHDLEAAYEDDSEQESIQGDEDEEEGAEVYEVTMSESGLTLQEHGVYEEDEEAGVLSSGGKSAEKVEAAVREFESLWEEAVDSEEVLILDENEVDPDTVFEVVKSHFGGAYGAPAQPRNKRNSNELVGKKALKNPKPRLDPSVLDRVPKDPSGLLEIDELAKLLAP